MIIYRLHKFSTFAFLIMVSFSLFSGPGSSKVKAFDDASEIHHSYLNQENFLDIKSYQFHKLKEEEWFESPEVGGLPVEVWDWTCFILTLRYACPTHCQTKLLFFLVHGKMNFMK